MQDRRLQRVLTELKESVENLQEATKGSIYPDEIVPKQTQCPLKIIESDPEGMASRLAKHPETKNFKIYAIGRYAPKNDKGKVCCLIEEGREQCMYWDGVDRRGIMCELREILSKPEKK